MAKPLREELKHYLRNDLKKVEGMINPTAAWLSAILCQIQSDIEVLSDNKSCYLEIGVFKGLFPGFDGNKNQRLQIPNLRRRPLFA